MPWSIRNNSVVVFQVLGTHGSYPRFNLLTESHALSVSEELVWSAVVQPPLPSEWEPAEVYSLVPEEIRLLAAVVLSETDPWNHGYYSPVYSRGEIFSLADIPLPLDSEEFKAFAAEKGRSLRTIGGRAEQNSPYQFHHAGSQQEAVELLPLIDSSDQLLLSGLHRLLSNLRLNAFQIFEEEALSQAFLSLGAAMEYLRLYLEGRDGGSKSYSDVYAYFEATFPDGSGLRDFLEWMYELRVISTHPANRFGEFWITPMMAGMAYELRKTLFGIYHHILTGEVPSDNSSS